MANTSEFTELKMKGFAQIFNLHCIIVDQIRANFKIKGWNFAPYLYLDYSPGLGNITIEIIKVMGVLLLP